MVCLTMGGFLKCAKVCSMCLGLEKRAIMRFPNKLGNTILSCN